MSKLTKSNRTQSKNGSGKGAKTKMTKEQKLKKIIKQAVKNGYEFPFSPYTFSLTEKLYGRIWIYYVIFSHDFCRAFWGEEDAQIEVGKKKLIGANLPNWMWHIQQLALSKDRIDYCYKYVK